jgi:hypothetical protein
LVKGTINKYESVEMDVVLIFKQGDETGFHGMICEFACHPHVGAMFYVTPIYNHHKMGEGAGV